jgi:cobalt-zinc-cadmium efflux system outer membrane protein
MTAFDSAPAKDEGPEKMGQSGKTPLSKGDDIRPEDLFLTSAQDPKKPRTIPERLTVGPDVPGSEVRPPVLPKGKEEYKKMIEKIIAQYFPDIPKVQRDPDFPPGPDGSPLTLTDLQQIAFANSPLLRQAASDVKAAQGAAIQAGAYPNPTIGYQSSGAGPGGGPMVGMFVEQSILFPGKLKTAQAAALMDVRAAEYAYRRAETDLMANIRGNYYAVVVAQDNIRANRGLVELTDEVYRVMVDQLRIGEVSPYEPNQLAVFAEQARIALVQARNSRMLAWRQLVASMGVPHMPPTALAGTANRPVPRLNFEKALAHVLTKHTDMLTTEATIEKARHNLLHAQITPYPDMAIQAGITNDLTAPGPSRAVSSLQVSFPIPLWDRNKGNIMQSQAALVHANEEPHRVQADLTARFAEAYRRYEENRVLLEMYRTHILPKQVQAFRGAVLVHFGIDPGKVAYADLVASEQNLVSVIPAYMSVLSAQWQAVVDVSSFLQTDQLYKMTDEIAQGPEVKLEELLKMPCTHRCPPAAPPATREGFSLEPAVPVETQSVPVQPAPAPVKFGPLKASVAPPAASEPVPERPQPGTPSRPAPLLTPVVPAAPTSTSKEGAVSGPAIQRVVFDEPRNAPRGVGVNNP